MFEKYSESSLFEAGGGGEYDVVVGFGWSNGVLIWVADTFRDNLQTPPCTGDLNASSLIAGAGDNNENGNHSTETLQTVSKRKIRAIELNSWDARWISEAVGGRAPAGG